MSTAGDRFLALSARSQRGLEGGVDLAPFAMASGNDWYLREPALGMRTLRRRHILRASMSSIVAGTPA